MVGVEMHPRSPAPTHARAKGGPTRPKKAGSRTALWVVLVVGAAVAAVATRSMWWSSATRPASLRETGTPVDEKLFEPGACVELPPIAGNRHTTVFLDAGHGGLDPGGVGEDQAGNPVHEANITLPVELDTATLLREHGFTVVVSRTGDETVSRPGPDDLSGGLFTAQGVHDDVAARDVCANMAKADLLVGIYFDAGGSSLDAGSVTGYDVDRSFSAANLRLATLVQNDVLATMNDQGWGIPNLGVVRDTALGGPAITSAAGDYHHLLLLGPADPGWFSTPSEMPGTLIEPLFVTDPFEAGIAETSGGQHVMADGLAQAVEQYFAPIPRRSASQ